MTINDSHYQDLLKTEQELEAVLVEVRRLFTNERVPLSLRIGLAIEAMGRWGMGPC